MALHIFNPFHSNSTNDQLTYSLISRGQTLILAFSLFSLILLFMILYIYFNFFLGRGHFSANAAANSISQLPHMQTRGAADQLVAVKTQSLGLDAATIKSLPIFIHGSLPMGASNSTVGEEKECSICLGLFQEEEVVKVLPICHHTYHSVCIDKWLATRSSCPLCRASLQLESAV